LPVGDGQYAFALNVQGRVLFDLNILVRQESIWLDVDRRWVGFARGHFEKYIITEDVSILDRSGEFVRIGLAGEAAKGILSDLRVGNALTMPWLGTTVMRWGDGAVPLIRQDFCGTLALEMLVPVAEAVALWEALTDSSRPAHAVAVGQDAVQIRRIEAGLPWPFCEITGEYLPAETGQLDRAVSFTKGCYLGQEVVERMRSRDVVARQLVRVQFDGDDVPSTGTILQDDQDREVGRVTSACRSPAYESVIGLAYVKTASAAAGTTLRARWADYCAGAEVGSVL
ncbi:MAG: CAF17-like 4Fe-4S cluster assembly/insertion protein YgfZ, partial [Candidatus Thorarchaeota archaeon]